MLFALSISSGSVYAEWRYKRHVDQMTDDVTYVLFTRSVDYNSTGGLLYVSCHDMGVGSNIIHQGSKFLGDVDVQFRFDKNPLNEIKMKSNGSDDVELVDHSIIDRDFSIPENIAIYRDAYLDVIRQMRASKELLVRTIPKAGKIKTIRYSMIGFAEIFDKACSNTVYYSEHRLGNQ